MRTKCYSIGPTIATSIAIRQTAENDKLKLQLEQSLREITTLTAALATTQKEIEHLKTIIEQSVQSPNCDAASQTDLYVDFVDPIFMADFFQSTRLCELLFVNDIRPNRFSSSSICPSIYISFVSEVFVRTSTEHWAVYASCPHITL